MHNYFRLTRLVAQGDSVSFRLQLRMIQLLHASRGMYNLCGIYNAVSLGLIKFSASAGNTLDIPNAQLSLEWIGTD